MMTTRFNNKIQSTILIASTLMLASCAYIKTNDSIKTGEEIANKTSETTITTIEKGKFETPPEIPQIKTNKPIEPDYSAPVPPDTAQASTSNSTKINHKEPLVNVRTTPSTKGRIVAVLKKGQAIEVLETKDTWVKISWHKGDTVKHGWLKRMFVEGYEQ